ncbi:T9SS type A sorting domain-containing protein [Chryseobacterium sp. Y16C]|uniref:T9SS type A sorting domain-containing protein n=1 Tax=Chryseobacterium sp. Y16C TaxID=2920939 RepID=UPI001F0B8E0D|nr:T9SS type A sorting domain-containing protein [Chryseobacterium sp. Y16C]UMQ43982.1 T9SS type A sorting domain-containing protein [Chryseobacterium sp. Y16C]
MKRFYIMFLLTLPLLLFSQGENDNWYFGGFAGVNFSNVTPNPLLNSAMGVIQQPVGSISDINGGLLFYTDGKYVWNRDHQIMPNGILNTNGWNPYGVQLCILPHPGNPNLYYIFTPVAFYNNNSGISSYTIIDMSLGNLSNGLPLGDVMPNSNSIPLVDENGASFSANNVNIVRHSDNNSFWVVVPNKTKLYSYLVNNQGLINTPVVSNMPLNIPNYSPTTHGAYLKISPKVSVSNNFSNYLYISHWGQVSAGNWASIKVLSFNNTTGKVTNDFVLDISTNPSGSSTAEFNNNGSILYIGANGNSKVYGIDMVNISGSVNSYLLPINYSSSTAGPKDMQRNKWGDIYMPFEDSNGYLAKILNINSFNNASIDVNNVYLQGKNTNNNLPQLVQTKNAIGDCVPNILLTSSETNTTFTYRASNSITTQTNYSTASNQNIKMKAGSYISLNPNTHIKGEFLAKIEGCRVGDSNDQSSGRNAGLFQKPIELSLDLRTKENVEEKNINVYPNPVSTLFTIDTGNEKLLLWELYDFSGKKVLEGEKEKADIQHLPSGTYILKIKLAKRNISKTIIKK